MKPISSAEALLKPLQSDEDIFNRVVSLIGKARSDQSQFWMICLDECMIQIPTMIPISGYPQSPMSNDANSLVHWLSKVTRILGAESIVIVWERAGDAQFTPSDIDWAAYLTEFAKKYDLKLRAQLLAHSNGVRWLTPDDYISANVINYD